MTTALNRALEFLAKRNGDSIELRPISTLPTTAYGFDPAGWDLFVILSKSPSTTLRGDEYVAVHRSTGEVRYLGVLGD